jgi:hypothetical protein
MSGAELDPTMTVFSCKQLCSSGLFDIGAKRWLRHCLLCSSGLWNTALLYVFQHFCGVPCVPSAHAVLLVFNVCSLRSQSVMNPCSICLGPVTPPKTLKDSYSAIAGGLKVNGALR